MSTKAVSIEDWDAIDGYSPAVRDEAGYLKRLREAIEAHADPAVPFVTWGYHHYMHGDSMPRSLLDEVAPSTPVIVWHRSCHEFFLNSAALAAAGIDEALMAGRTQSQKDQANLERGHFFEQGVFPILPRIAPFVASPEIFRKGLEFSETMYHRSGITLAGEPGGLPSKPIQEAINAVHSDDATGFNHQFMADGKSQAEANRDDAAMFIAGCEAVADWGRGRTACMPKQAKLFMDGAIFSQLMQMRDGYSDGHHGAWLMDPRSSGTRSRRSGTPGGRSTSTTTAMAASTSCSVSWRRRWRGTRARTTARCSSTSGSPGRSRFSGGSSWVGSSAATRATSPPSRASTEPSG